VIPHDVEVDVVSGSFPERAGSIMNLVTNWWVERCLYGKRLVDPTDDVLSRPFDKLSVNGKLLALAQISCLVMLTSQGSPV
jgi:DNA replication regulator DPB11